MSNKDEGCKKLNKKTPSILENSDETMVCY
jgi:hypothetical protein